MADNGSLFTPLNIDPIELPEQPTGSQGSLFGLAEQKKFDLDEAVERNKRNVENSLIGNLGFASNSGLGKYTNLLASAASGLSRDVVGRAVTLPIDVTAGLAAASIPEEANEAWNRTKQGIATPEDAALLNTVAPGEDGVPQTYGQRIQGVQDLNKTSQKVANFFDISSVVDTSRRDVLSENLREETAGGVANLREAYAQFQKGEYADAALTGVKGLGQTVGNALATGATEPGAVLEYTAENVPQLAAYAFSPLLGAATNVGYGFDAYRKGITQYAENNNDQVPSGEDRTRMAGFAASAAAAEQLGDLLMVRGLGDAGGNLLRSAASVAASMGREGLTEGYQTYAENEAKLEDTSIEDVVEGATIGAFVGGNFQLAGEIGSRRPQVTEEGTPTAPEDLLQTARDTGDVSALAEVNPAQAVAVLNELSRDATPEQVQTNIEQADAIEANLAEQLDGLNARMENNSAEAVQEFRDILASLTPDDPDYAGVQQAIQMAEAYTPAMRKQDEAAAARVGRQLDEVRQVSERLRVDSTPDVDSVVADARNGNADAVLTLTMQNPDAVDTTVAAELSRNEALPMEQRDAMAKFATAQEASNTLKDRGVVNSDVINGGQGFKGLNQYRSAVRTAVQAGNFERASQETAQLASFAATRETKYEAIASAYEEVKGTNNRLFVAPDSTGNWVRTPTKQANGLVVNAASFRLRDDVKAEATALRTAADAFAAIIAARQAVPVQQGSAATAVGEPAVEAVAPAQPQEAAPQPGNTVATETGELTALASRTGAPVTSDNYQKVNLLGELFSQETGGDTDASVRPLAAAKNFMSSVRNGSVKLADYLSNTEELSPNQRSAVNRFFRFQGAFDQFIQQGFTVKRQPDFRFQDYSQFLINEDGTVDENARTAIAYGAFTWLAENANSVFNTAEGINMILNRDSEDEVSNEAYATLGHVGTREDVVANQLGARIVQALGLRSRPEAAANEQARLESALGIVAIGALRRAGVIAREEVADATIQRLRGTPQNATKAVHTFINVATEQVDGRTRAIAPIRQIKEDTTGSQSVVNKLFSVEANGTEPSYEPVKFNQQYAKRTRQEIPAVLAETLDKEGAKAHRIRQDMNQVWGNLSVQALYRIAGVINDAPTHAENIASRQAKNEGLMAQVDNYIAFRDKMIADPTTDGIEQALYFGRSVWKPQRVGLSTNVINPQTSKVHRHMLAMDNWETEVDMADQAQVDNFKLRVMEAFDKKTEGKATALVLKDYDALVNNPVIQAGVAAIATMLTGETDLSANNEQAIVDAVEATESNFHGLDALVALAHQKNAVDGKFKTTFMGEVDGLTNGPALSLLMLGAKDFDVMNQTGFFELSSPYDQFNDFKGQGNLDLYESSVKGALGRLDVADATRLDALQVITGQLLTDEGNVTSKGRAVIKKPFTAMMFGSNTATAVQDMAQGFVESIYDKIEKAAEKGDVGGVKKVLDAANTLIGKKGLTLDSNMGIESAMQYKLSDAQQQAISTSFFELLGQHVQTSLEENYATFLARRDVVNQSAQLSFKLYDIAYNALVAQVEETSPTIARRTTRTGESQTLRTLTSQEFDQVRQRLKGMEPILMTAMAKKSNQLDAGMHMSKAKRELDSSLPYSSEVYFGEPVETMTANGLVSRKSTLVSGMRTLAVDPGVAAFITAIHSTDSAIASQVYSLLNALNVHDALGVGLHEVQRVGQLLNQATYENMRDYSAPSEMVNTLERVLVGMNQLMQDPDVADRMQSGLKALAQDLGKRDLGTIEQHLDRARRVAVAADTAKLTMMSNMKAVGQYATDGGSYTVTDADRAVAQDLLSKLGTEFNESAVASASALDVASAATALDLKAAAAKSLSNKSTQTLAPATTLNTLDRLEQTPAVEQVREAMLTQNIPLESAKEVLDGPTQAELLQAVAEKTAPVMSVWGEVGTPLVQSNVELASMLANTQMTGRELASALESLNTDKFTAALLDQIKKTINPNTKVVYVTPSTGPEGAMGTGVNKARGWYHQEQGQGTIYIKSPDFVESGITQELLTHELVHAALAQIVAEHTGKGTMAGKAVASLEALRVKAEAYINANTGLSGKFRNSVKDVHELLAWGLTNADFQQEVLAKIPARNVTGNKFLNGLSEFINSLAQMLFRKNEKGLDTGLGLLVAQSAGLFRDAAALRATRDSQTMLYEDAIDHVNAMTSEEVLNALEGASNRVSSTQHKADMTQLIRDVVEPMFGPYGAFKEAASADRAITPMDVYIKSYSNGQMPFASAALAGPFAINHQEGYVLESIQAVMEEAMKNPQTVFVRQALSNLFNEAAKLPVANFHNGDWSTATQQEKDLAQEKRDFIFKLSPGVTSKSSHLAQFAAISLASEEVRGIMDFTTLNGQVPLKTLPIATRLVELFRRIMTKLVSLHTKVQPGDQGLDALQTLVGQLVDIEAKRKARLMDDRLSALDQVEIALGNAGATVRERAELLASMPFFTQSSSKLVRGAGAVVRTVAGDRVEAVLDHMTKMRDNVQRKKNGVIMGLVEEARGVYDGNRLAAELFKGAKAIEKDRKDTIENTVAQVNAAFKDGGSYLTDKTRASLTNALLRTNASVLFEKFGLVRLQEMMEQPHELRTEQFKLEQELKNLTQHWGYMSGAAKDLAYHKVFGGNVSHNLMLNTRNIANLLGTKVANTLFSADVAKIVPVLDQLVAMNAISYLGTVTKREAIEVMRTEANRVDNQNNGIDMMLRLHAGLQARSTAELFQGQEAMQQYGYVPEIHDNKIEVLLVDRKDLPKYQRAGYIQGTELQKDSTDGVKDDRVLVTRRGSGQTALLTGALSFTGMHRKGSSPERQSVNLLNGAQATSKQHLALIRKNKEAKVADLFARGWSYDPRKAQAGVMVPVMDPKGNIADYRYMMTEANRDALLDRDSSMDQVLGTLAGQIVDKTDTIVQNNDVVRSLADQYRAEYSKNPARFVRFGKDSTDPDLAELYRLLPESTKREIKKVWNNDNMMIPINQLNLIVGYRKYSLTEAFDKAARDLTKKGMAGERNWAEQLFVMTTEAFLGEKAALRVGQAEDVMQELVKEAKDILVVKNISTLVGNMLSNISLLLIEGVSIKDILSSHAIAIKGATDYRKDARRVQQLQQALEIGYVPEGQAVLEQELIQARDRMARNPIKPLIDAGLMPTIVEDVEADDSRYSYKSRLQTKVEKYTSKVPKLLRDAGKQVYMTHDTSVYKFLSQTTQLSDLVARYAMYQHLINRKVDPLSSADALLQAEESFVNYDLPSHRSIQFMNDMGLVMFTKYYIRIQKTIARLIRQKPARVIATAVAHQFIDSIESILDSSWFNKIGNNPFQVGALNYPGTLDELPVVKALL